MFGSEAPSLCRLVISVVLLLTKLKFNVLLVIERILQRPMHTPPPPSPCPMKKIEYEPLIRVAGIIITSH